MGHATYSRESKRNRQAYSQLRDQIQQAYQNQYVAMALGKVIGAADSLDGARELVEHLDPVPEYYLVFPGGTKPDFDLTYDLSWSR